MLAAKRIAYLIPIFTVFLAASSCSRKTSVSVPQRAEFPKTLQSEKNTTIVAVGFLENRVKEDPDDFVALNKLASYYLRLHRETEQVKYLEQALGAASASLKSMPADQNLGGLSVMAQVELDTHNFTRARDLARELTEYQPQKSFSYQLLGDALLELGDYEKAADAYKQMQALDPGSVSTETRLARFELLRGNISSAQRRYEAALAQAQRSSLPSDDTIAWCHWQLGEVAFNAGNTDDAIRHYQNALTVIPRYLHAVTSLARLRAGQGDFESAIELFESVIGEEPDPVDAAALGDIYTLAGRREDAERLHKIAETVGQRDTLHQALYGRYLILFWADHDLKSEQAYEKARRDYEVRRDIFGADTLAWAALKAGKLPEARQAMNEALRLGTQDARFFYHAGMIARALGDKVAANNYLQRALDLNPHFDPIQSSIAKKMIQQ